MSEETQKRYIVSFKEEKAERSYAATVLGVKTRSVQDGVKFLSTDKPVEDVDILHFEDIGATVLPLSEEDAEELRKDERVAEVVEDIEVFALDCGEEGAQDRGEEWAQDWDDWEAGEAAEYDLYEAGYQQALADIYGGWGVPGFTSPAPTQPTPSPLVWPCPPGYRLELRCVPIKPPVPPPPPPPPSPQPIPWNITMVKANRVWHRVTGRDAKVAIIDTGIDKDHPDLSVSGGASFVPGVSSWDDDQGHGTHCAGIVGARNNRTGIVGVAPGCSLYAVKVMRPTPDGRASGRLSWILAGMNWAARNGMHVASMSLGSDAPSADMPCIIAYQRAAEQLIAKGCIVIAAAGNAGRTSTPWVGQPARCPGFMAVAAVDRDGKLASFSSRGPASLCPECGVEISAPGVSVRSTLPGGGYGTKSGTSMACPHVSGAAALLKELRPTASPAQIRARLKSTARDLGAPGNDPEFGEGLLDCYEAVFR